MSSLFDLRGKTALITGSSRGLGFAIAQGLGQHGANLILNGRNRQSLDEAVSTLRGEGLTVGGAAFNVSDAAEIASAVQAIEAENGAIDILVNNAGIARRGPLEELAEKDWRAVLDINLTAPFLMAKQVVKGMIARQSGKIINIGSLMSEVGRDTTGAYAASKGGIKMLTKAMTVEWAKHNIQINGIGPGYFVTDMVEPLINDPAFDGWLRRRTPAGRWGDPKELIGTAVFLSSEASDFVNGQMIYVDGGILASL